MNEYRKKLKNCFYFVLWVFVEFIFVKIGLRIDKFIDIVLKVKENLEREIKFLVLINLIRES